MQDVLFLGNGINRAFNGDSWNNLVEKISKEYESSLTADDVKHLPFPMKVVALSGDRVDKAMQFISKDMNFVNSDRQSELIRRIFDLPIENIITANYTFELEQISGIKPSLYSYRKIRKFTKGCKGKEDKFGLFRYYQPDNSDKKIWHIHDDITAPSTVIMGNYYYGKLLSEIQVYTANFIRRYNTLTKRGLVCAEQSWIDSFLTKNVHILGFGLDLSEADIWWLICCKKRNFPDTKIYFYVPKDKKHPLGKAKEALLRSYNVDIVDDIPFEGEYERFYHRAIERIESEIKNGGKTNEIV